ncbi:DUF4286 family protein [Muriicola marianensis]|uniref:Putative gamma-glutamylcyclotransferase n=1 Tax=Muriicola marianensis TaxID=1324801 RepID=A0ABQ1QXX7_9FLAO|nr:DUF4286 family protein [Muriicola marianensis]GGD47688.1 hypothetical protein GCM10011361_13110 [Muriicola marianensis]
MLIYNVTLHVEDAILPQWLDWMKSIHIPEVLATGKFLEATMTRILSEEDSGGSSYSVQYKVRDRTALESYYREDAARLRKETEKLFGNSVIAFRTELEVLSIDKPPIKSATAYLFTYGTLQEKDVQKMIFSRTLNGKRDSLSAHRISEEMVGGLYPTIRRSENPNDKVEGLVYVISEEELTLVDAYEGEAYERMNITLESGVKAWVYLGKTGI